MFGLGKKRKDRLAAREEKLRKKLSMMEGGARKDRLEDRADKLSVKKKEAAFKDYYKSMEENYKGSKLNPFKYTAPEDGLNVMEEENRSPVGFLMTGAKVKGSSPNNAFSLKDYNKIMGAQNSNKIASEGNFKTKSQNIYSSFDSPMTYRGPGVLKDSGVTEGETAIAAADRRTQQNAQGLQNAATGVGMAMDVLGGVASAAKAFKGG